MVVSHLSAVVSASFSSKVRLSPEERKLSEREQGRGNLVAFANMKWSQLLGTYSLQYRASRDTFLPPPGADRLGF